MDDGTKERARIDHARIDQVKVSLVSQAARLETAQVRTDSLLKLYDDLPHQQGEDLLRAVVVWLHGALEEALRLHVASALVEGDRTALDRVPLIGCPAMRPEKFFLGSLVAFRDRTVMQVLHESVEAYVARLTFNNFGDVAAALDLLGLPSDRSASLKDSASARALDELCERRHKIVHEGDLMPGMKPELRPLSKKTVVEWQSRTTSYIAALVAVVEATRCEVAMGPEWTANNARLQREEATAREIAAGPSSDEVTTPGT